MLSKLEFVVLLICVLTMSLVTAVGLWMDFAPHPAVSKIAPALPGVTAVIAEWTEEGDGHCTMRSTRYLDASYVSVVCDGSSRGLGASVAGPYYEEEAKK